MDTHSFFLGVQVEWDVVRRGWDGKGKRADEGGSQVRVGSEGASNRDCSLIITKTQSITVRSACRIQHGVV